MKKENLAIIEMLICATLWSIAGIFMKLIPWNGFAIAGMRSFFSFLTFMVYMGIKHIRLKINKETVTAGLFTAAVYTCFTVANKLTTAANAIVLQFTSPVFIVIFTALFFKTRIKKNDIAVVLLTLIGITLCFLDQMEGGHLLGNCVAVLSGMFMAGMFIIVGNQSGEIRFSSIALGHFFTFLLGLPFVLLTHPLVNMTTVSCIVILGVLQLGISYILYVKATEYCPPLACCLLGVVEPLLNPVWVLIFNGEKPGILALIGAAIVLVSVTVWCAWGQTNDSEAKNA